MPALNLPEDALTVADLLEFHLDSLDGADKVAVPRETEDAFYAFVGSVSAPALVAPTRHEEVVEVFLPEGMDMAWIADFEAFSKGAKANDDFRSAVKTGARSFHISALEAERASLALRSSVVVDPLAKSRIDAAVAAFASAKRFRVAPKEYAATDFACMNLFAEVPLDERMRMLCATNLSHPGHQIIGFFGFLFILCSLGGFAYFSFEGVSEWRRKMAKAFEERRAEIEACEEEAEILGSCSSSKSSSGRGSL